MFPNRIVGVGFLYFVMAVSTSAAQEASPDAVSYNEPIPSQTIGDTEKKESRVESVVALSAADEERVDCFYKQYRYHPICSTESAK